LRPEYSGLGHKENHGEDQHDPRFQTAAHTILCAHRPDVPPMDFADTTSSVPWKLHSTAKRGLGSVALRTRPHRTKSPCQLRHPW
jgi:hypothetical protein